MAHFDLSEVRDLADRMEMTEENVQRNSRSIVNDAADRVTRQWRRNVDETGEAYAKWYMRSIGHDAPRWADGRWSVVIEPDTSLPQGNMSTGFEYGSINQTTPHMDAHRAVDDEEEPFVRACRDFGRNVLWAGIRA